MSVRRCQQEVDSREFVEWMVYDQEFPIGPERVDIAGGVIASVVANVGGNKTEPMDFMPLLKPKRKSVQTPDEMKAVMRQALEAHARRKRKK